MKWIRGTIIVLCLLSIVFGCWKIYGIQSGYRQGQRAYEELEREGFLQNIPGKGCFVAPQNRELLREAQLRRVEEFLSLAVDEARKGGFTLEELTEMLNILYQGE